MNNSLSINSIDAFVFNFDGVLIDNLVYINQNGEESVCCSRSDGHSEIKKIANIVLKAKGE